MRVDDYFPYGCGDLVRERDGRQVGRVRAVISNYITVIWEDTGWVTQGLLCSDLEPANKFGPFLQTEV
jgi:hypothetical protein